MESLWVLILVIVGFCTIVTVRMFVNGAREESGEAALDELATAETPAGVPSPSPRAARRAAARAGAAPAAIASAAATEAPAAPAQGKASRRAAAKAAQPAAWPGGDCPSCGSPTVPKAKFCGECGHRLVP